MTLKSSRKRNRYEVVVENYLNIDLSKYEDGGKVIFYKDMIEHRIIMKINGEKIHSVRESKRIKGLPLDHHLLK